MREARHLPGNILYDSLYMKCLAQANPQRQKVDSWLPGARGKAEWGETLS